MSSGISRQAIRLQRSVMFPKTSSILLQVHVKTGVKPPKEDSIISVDESQVKLQVQSPGVNDQANTAIKWLLSKVRSKGVHCPKGTVLKVPKSNIYIVRGEKAQYKCISVNDYTTTTDDDQKVLSLIKEMLLDNAVESKPAPTPPSPSPKIKHQSIKTP